MATSMICRPGPRKDEVVQADGTVARIPAGWALLLPGDAGLTRRVKAAADHWVVQEKRGRRTFSKGVWAPADVIESQRRQLEAERSTEQYAAKRQAAAKRRDRQQAAYIQEFTESVLAYLDFDPKHASIAADLAVEVAAHATPVGSGTVARTRRISVDARAEAAVIAWLRHRTTAYDDMKISREKGKRRDVRRQLARRSKQLLESYRRGDERPKTCPLRNALRAQAVPPADESSEARDAAR